MTNAMVASVGTNEDAIWPRVWSGPTMSVARKGMAVNTHRNREKMRKTSAARALPSIPWGRTASYDQVDPCRVRLLAWLDPVLESKPHPDEHEQCHAHHHVEVGAEVDHPGPLVADVCEGLARDALVAPVRRRPGYLADAVLVDEVGELCPHLAGNEEQQDSQGEVSEDLHVHRSRGRGQLVRGQPRHAHDYSKDRAEEDADEGDSAGVDDGCLEEDPPGVLVWLSLHRPGIYLERVHLVHEVEPDLPPVEHRCVGPVVL